MGFLFSLVLGAPVWILYAVIVIIGFWVVLKGIFGGHDK